MVVWSVSPFSSFKAYQLSGADPGEKNSYPSPQRHFPTPAGRPQGNPKPEKIPVANSKFGLGSLPRTCLDIYQGRSPG